jgi:hypothetical protein
MWRDALESFAAFSETHPADQEAGHDHND